MKNKCENALNALNAVGAYNAIMEGKIIMRPENDTCPETQYKLINGKVHVRQLYSEGWSDWAEEFAIFNREFYVLEDETNIEIKNLGILCAEVQRLLVAIPENVLSAIHWAKERIEKLESRKGENDEV